MWGWIKKTARTVWNGVSGAINLFGSGLSWLVHRILGIGEFFISILGFKPKKKLRLKVLILPDSNNKPLVASADVQILVDEAKRVLRKQANVRLIPSVGQTEIVGNYPDAAPAYVRTPKCDGGGFKHNFTRVGKWFRRKSGPYTGRGGVVVFVVDDVQNKGGCFMLLVDFGYIDVQGVMNTTTAGRRLLLAHELGHACDLLHRDNAKNLMEPSGSPRTDHLTRWQRTVLRSSSHVRYL